MAKQKELGKAQVHILGAQPVSQYCGPRQEIHKPFKKVYQKSRGWQNFEGHFCSLKVILFT